MDFKFIDQAALSLYNSMLNVGTNLNGTKEKAIADTAYRRALTLYESRSAIMKEYGVVEKVEKDYEQVFVGKVVEEKCTGCASEQACTQHTDYPQEDEVTDLFHEEEDFKAKKLNIAASSVGKKRGRPKGSVKKTTTV